MYQIFYYLEEENEVNTNGEVQNSHPDFDQNSWLNSSTISNGIDLNEPISMAKIYARREEVIQKYKFRIGILSSAVLENPEEKVHFPFVSVTLDTSSHQLYTDILFAGR